MDKNSILKNNKVVEGLLIALASIFLIIESFKLHNNKSWALSPALFPIIITISVLALSIILIIKGLRENTVNTGQSNKEGLKKLGLIIIISFAYLIILPKLHFLISSIIYLFSFLFILGERKWLLLITISIITPLLIQYLFGNLLDVFLP